MGDTILPRPPAEMGAPNSVSRLPSAKESFLQREAISRHPHEFEPLFASLRIRRPDFDLSGIDLTTQLNNLRKLFRYVRGKEQDAFRIDIELIDGSIHEPLRR